MANEFELMQDALELPMESGTSPADIFVESRDETADEDATSFWLEEVGRNAQFRAGSATPKPVDQVMREARAVFGWKSFRGRER